jgi:hypothetical protein
MEAYGGSGAECRRHKSQARATFFLVLFLLLVPTVLAFSHTSSITGEVTEGTATMEAPETAEVVEVPTESQIEEQDPESEQPTEKLEVEPIELVTPTQPEQPEQPLPAQNETEPEQPQEQEPAQNKTPAELEPEPEINETIPETNQTEETIIQEPATNETTNETNKTNETNATAPTNMTNTTEHDFPEPCNITCGECEILDQANCTCVNDQACEQPAPTIPEMPVPMAAEPVFRISLDPPARITRGETVQFVATIENTGSVTGNATAPAAFNVNPHWIMPEGLQLIATDDDCSTLLPGLACTMIGHVYVEPGTIGRKEIRVLVDYE